MPRRELSGERNVIGSRIRAVRLAQSPSVSQEDLAARLAVAGVYVDRSALARIELGQRFIRDYEIIAVAKALKVPIASLFEKANELQGKIKKRE